jgi:hypothetical protein
MEDLNYWDGPLDRCKCARCEASRNKAKDAPQGMPDPAGDFRCTDGTCAPKCDCKPKTGETSTAAPELKTLDDMPSFVIEAWVEGTGFRKDEITETHDDGSITKTTVEKTGVIDAAAVDRLVQAVEAEEKGWGDVLTNVRRQRDNLAKELDTLKAVGSLVAALAESQQKVIADQKREIEILRSLIRPQAQG